MLAPGNPRADALKEALAARKAEKEARKKAKSKRLEKARERRRTVKRATKEAAFRATEEGKAQQAELEAARAEERVFKQYEKAQQELARREMARRHLLPYMQRVDPRYKAGWFHKDLCLRLERFLDDVVNERSPRLMLFVPPRHGKSVTGSLGFPSWAIGKYPWLEFIQTSYAEALQLEFSKKIQQLIAGDEFRLLFPGVIIPKGFQAVHDWKIAQVDAAGREKLTGGGLMAAGVGGPLSGRGAHIATVDDPLKNREEADSEVVRESIKSWYSSTFTTRLSPGGGILIIQTRWHDDDLSGWQLRMMAEAIKEETETGKWPEDAERWEVISYPAIATEDEKYRKKGEALHPERYSLKELYKKRRNMIPRDWSALYQQSPVAEEGEYFTKDMIRKYAPTQLPKRADLNVFAAGDLAISQRETADFTVFFIIGLDAEDNVWILDIRRGRWDADEITDQILDIQRTWKPIRFGIEREKVLIAIGPLLNKKIRDQRAYDLLVEDLHIGGRDKRARARPWQGRMKQGKVYWPATHPLTDVAINEHLRFDAGVNDDTVDAGAWTAQMIQNEVYQPPRKEKEKPWREKLKGYVKKSQPNEGGAMAA